MVVQHNLTAMNANRYLGINNNKLSKSLEKLSSGYAINRAGDNAAGLAVSEKMRSQIAGMTQAVKNAQDGISMVQTFEGALTETDSILQRMKTLADQMANGSYDDPVDRTAAQQEFLQLNDELDQIADTDFNGVVVLNGGRMSDGTQAVGITSTTNERGVITRTLDKTADGAGMIDYANKAAQLEAEKNAKIAEIDAKIAALGSVPNDIKKDDEIWNTVDEHGYDADAADALWTALDLDADKVASVSVTFTAKVDEDGVVSYEATSGEASDKTQLTEDQLTQFAATATSATDASGLGGFKLAGVGSNGQAVTAIFDATKVNDGDVVTLKFTGPGASAKAPTTVGIADDSLKFTGSCDKDETKYKVEIGELTDDDMTADVKAGLDALNGMTVNASVALTASGPAATTALTLKDASGAALTINAADGVVSNAAGDKLFHVAVANGKVTISTLNAAKSAADKKIAEIDYSGATAIPATGTAGTVEMKLALDSYTVPGASTIDVSAEETDLGDEIKALQAKKDALNAEKKALEDDYRVSVSDTFDNSEAKMTYKDSITLQVGARTKDAVNFTFKYASTAIGDLTADLDCSASGLGTNLLNLNTQEDANFAIDKIDQAINKVSLVRGTFGAIQNRLEHKIDNLNVSVENLTSAESQIRDTNMPQEMMNFTKQQILAQASQSMLAQANQLPQSVLSLLQ